MTTPMTKDGIWNKSVNDAYAVPPWTPKNVSTIHGKMRVGGSSYTIRDGKLYRLNVDAHGHLVSETIPCGDLCPGYRVHVDGKDVNLNSQRTVIMQFQMDHSPKIHDVLKMGENAPLVDSMALKSQAAARYSDACNNYAKSLDPHFQMSLFSQDGFDAVNRNVQQLDFAAQKQQDALKYIFSEAAFDPRTSEAQAARALAFEHTLALAILAQTENANDVTKYNYQAQEILSKFVDDAGSQVLGLASAPVAIPAAGVWKMLNTARLDDPNECAKAIAFGMLEAAVVRKCAEKGEDGLKNFLDKRTMDIVGDVLRKTGPDAETFAKAMLQHNEEISNLVKAAVFDPLADKAAKPLFKQLEQKLVEMEKEPNGKQQLENLYSALAHHAEEMIKHNATALELATRPNAMAPWLQEALEKRSDHAPAADSHHQTNAADPHHQTNAADPHHQTNAADPHHQTNAADPHHQTNAADPNHQTNAADPNHQTNAADPHHQTSAADPHHQTNAADPHHQTNAADPHHQTNAADPHHQTHGADPNHQTHAADQHQQTNAADPNHQSHAADPHHQTHAADPNHQTHAADPNHQTHGADPNHQTHAADPNHQTHGADPNHQTHAADQHQQTNAADPNHQSHAADPNQQTHVADPHQQSHAADPNQQTHAADPHQQSHAADPSQQTHAADPHQQTHAADPHHQTNAADPNQQPHAADEHQQTHAADQHQQTDAADQHQQTHATAASPEGPTIEESRKQQQDEHARRPDDRDDQTASSNSTNNQSSANDQNPANDQNSTNNQNSVVADTNTREHFEHVPDYMAPDQQSKAQQDTDKASQNLDKPTANTNSDPNSQRSDTAGTQAAEAPDWARTSADNDLADVQAKASGASAESDPQKASPQKDQTTESTAAQKESAPQEEESPHEHSAGGGY